MTWRPKLDNMMSIIWYFTILSTVWNRYHITKQVSDVYRFLHHWMKTISLTFNEQRIKIMKRKDETFHTLLIWTERSFHDGFRVFGVTAFQHIFCLDIEGFIFSYINTKRIFVGNGVLYGPTETAFHFIFYLLKVNRRYGFRFLLLTVT